MKTVGFTTSIPVEILFCANIIPVDLNNIFIRDSDPNKLVEASESIGFPRNTCAWIKGIYSATINNPNIDAVIDVIEGDCTNAKALLEVLALRGMKNIPFSYPFSRDYKALEEQILLLCKIFGVSINECIDEKRKIDIVRKKVAYLDELTWKYNKATGSENHIWQVSCSDFNGNYSEFSKDIDAKICDIEKREPNCAKIRLGYLGVPPINPDLYDFIETLDSRVVFNETQRQFSMVQGIGIPDIVEVYRKYTYPYSINLRLEDIIKEIELRKIDGVIHYTQSFCFRGIEDIVLRKELNVPVLTLECDRPGSLDARTKLRIEAFIDMLLHEEYIDLRKA